MIEKKPKNLIQNEKGLASVEAVVLVVLFTTMLFYTLGFFGVVHTGVLHNIHARTYAFETFRHRANLRYFRENSGANPLHYYNKQNRVHGINYDDGNIQANQVATERPITMGLELDESGRQQSIHNSQIYERVPASGRNTSVSVNPIWIKILYGLCLQASCGG